MKQEGIEPKRFPMRYIHNLLDSRDIILLS